MDFKFSQPETFLSSLDASAVSAIIASSTDLALLISEDDIIRDISCTSSQFAQADFTPWRGAPVEDVVAADGFADLRNLMASARYSDTTASCHVTHELNDQVTLAVRYSACAVGTQDDIILLGWELTSLASLRNRMSTMLQKMEHATGQHQVDAGHPSLSEQIYQRASEKVQGDTRTTGYLKSQIGTVPLKELVRDTTDMIEKDCISTALRLTGNNRALAARVLGLSRQSLYIKLRRYGLADEALD